jgi:hypothetical protein
MQVRTIRFLLPVIGAMLITRLLTAGMAEAATWSVVASPSVGTVSELRAVASVSANDVWAVGAGSTSAGTQTLAEHWDGTAWSVVPSANPAANASLFGVAAVATDDVWAVGRVDSASPPVIEHWNGRKWGSVNPPKQAGFLDAVTAVATDDVWAVGETLGAGGAFQPLIEHWNGRKWGVVASPAVGPQNTELSGLAAVSATDIWAVGFFLATSGGPSQTLTLHWDGSGWSVVPSPDATVESNRLQAAAAVATNDVWAVGQATSGSSVNTLIERWDGTTWGVVASPAAGQLRGIAVVSPTDIWAVGSVTTSSGPTQTVIEQWDGAGWTVVASPDPSASLNTLDATATDPSSGQTWAVGAFFNTTNSVQQTLTEFTP